MGSLFHFIGVKLMFSLPFPRFDPQSRRHALGLCASAGARRPVRGGVRRLLLLFPRTVASHLYLGGLVVRGRWFWADLLAGRLPRAGAAAGDENAEQGNDGADEQAGRRGQGGGCLRDQG